MCDLKCLCKNAFSFSLFFTCCSNGNLAWNLFISTDSFLLLLNWTEHAHHVVRPAYSFILEAELEAEANDILIYTAVIPNKL